MHTGNFIVKNYTIPLTSCGLYAIIFYCHEVIIFIYDFLKDKFYMERYRSGHNGTDSKSVVPSGTVGSNPTRSAMSLSTDFVGRLLFYSLAETILPKIYVERGIKHTPLITSSGLMQLAYWSALLQPF